jgi:hypothetical protein
MRHSQTEKMEIIRIIEQSHLPIKHTPVVHFMTGIDVFKNMVMMV